MTLDFHKATNLFEQTDICGTEESEVQEIACHTAAWARMMRPDIPKRFKQICLMDYSTFLQLSRLARTVTEFRLLK
jgi:hypothetical protein